MLHFRGRIPLTIYPMFWLFAALIGYASSGSFLGTVIWVGIIFVSVMIHEYGHALTALLFGKSPRIELVALGGLTYHDAQNLSFWKQFLIVFNGPLFGFLLFIAASFLLQIPQLAAGTIGYILMLTRVVNLFWTIVNLLPVLPLDGGQLLRIVLEKIFGLKGFKYTLVVSTAIATCCSLFFFLYQAFLAGAFFFLFAYQCFDTLRKTRHITERDRDETLKRTLEQAEECMQSGNKQQAETLLQEVRLKSKEGILFNLATQYLAFLSYEKGKSKEAYELLLSMRDELASDALCLLHKAAFEEKDYRLVSELAGECFQHWPTAETALRNAAAHAKLKQSVPAIGWLQTALNEGVLDKEKTLADPIFDSIRNDPSFQELLESI